MKNQNLGVVIEYRKVASPIGALYLIAREGKLAEIVFEQSWQRYCSDKAELIQSKAEVLEQSALQLQQYFAGTRFNFSLPLAPKGTEFQIRTWTALTKIPYGQTFSYKQQAELIGAPKAVRAVGRANGMNPIGVIVPCHRVIGSNGTLTGYAGGLEIKQYLLDHESKFLGANSDKAQLNLQI